MALDLFSPGAYFRAPGGNIENVGDQKPVISWAAWSINSDAGPVVGWDRSRMLWTAAGIPNFPWQHCRKIEDVEYLIDIGEQYSSPAIGCNIEDVVSDKLSLQQVGGILQDFWVNKYQKPVHMATLPWVQNGQGWANMSFAVAALEIFPRLPTAVFPNGYDAKVCQDCIDHAFAEGLTKVTLMLETKPPMDAQIYGAQFNICHSLYTGDDINTNTQAWAAWQQPQPCVKPDTSTMPLTPTEKKEFRTQLRRFCLVAQKYESKWHYTQNRPYTGLGAPASDTHYNDCSSYVAIAFYKAGRNSGVKVDDPLGYHYTGWGNTGSCYQEMKKYKAPVDKYRIGDVALYLEPGGFGDHMTVCIEAGDAQSSVWSSFGSEAGPDVRNLKYRSDLTGVYRPEDLR